MAYTATGDGTLNSLGAFNELPTYIKLTQPELDRKDNFVRETVMSATKIQ